MDDEVRLIIDAKTYLSNIGEWPSIPFVARPVQWLEGFDEDEKKHALAILDAFIFFSTRQTTKMLASAFHSLSGELTADEPSYDARVARWRSFLESVIVTMPTGETPNPTDSGHLFLRIVRQELGIHESHIVYPDQVADEVTKGDSVVFVDDFVGSGEQFLHTWNRPYWNCKQASIAQLARDLELQVYYIPVLATHVALSRVSNEAPEVKMRPCHTLVAEYSALDLQSLIFPPELRESASDFIDSVHSRHAFQHPRGFWDLALAVGFEHSVPDADLGMIWEEVNGWSPLLARK